MEMRKIAVMHSDFPSKFGIPRQSGLVNELRSYIEFEAEFRNPDVIRGLEGFSHIWVIWMFSENIRTEWTATVRPPRLGGNTRIGVFATRSPFRPNPIGMSCVKIEEIRNTDKGPVIVVSGADLMDGTPILDIKPYIPVSDCHTEALGGFTDETSKYRLNVSITQELMRRIPEDKRKAVIAVLENDPRPAYHHDSERLYGFPFADMEIKFKVNERELTVCDIIRA